MKHQQPLVLQRDFDTAVKDMELRTPTIATPSLLKLVLTLGFQMVIQDELTTVLHPFVLVQHTALVSKFLRGQAYWYAMVAFVPGDLYLADVEIISAPNRVILLHFFNGARAVAAYLAGFRDMLWHGPQCFQRLEGVWGGDVGKGDRL